MFGRSCIYVPNRKVGNRLRVKDDVMVVLAWLDCGQTVGFRIYIDNGRGRTVVRLALIVFAFLLIFFRIRYR